MPLTSMQLVQITSVVITATVTVYIGAKLSSDDHSESSASSADGDQHHQITNHEEITVCQALVFPLYASAVLLFLFFFFNYVQYLLLFFLIIGASFSLYQVSTVLLSTPHSVVPIVIQRYHLMASAVLTAIVVLEWFRSGNFICHDLLGCALCILFIHSVRFPSLKIASLCLVLLLLYDAFWVFYSEYIFNKNVMVEVATKQASNPIHDLGERFHISALTAAQKTIELPLKLIFPGAAGGRSIMLGLGDIALPGALVALALRSDIAISKLVQMKSLNDDLELARLESSSLIADADETHGNKPVVHHSINVKSSNLFRYAMIGYFVGLCCAFIGNMLSGHAQPALIYLVPSVLLPILGRAYAIGKISELWSGPYRFDIPLQYREN